MLELTRCSIMQMASHRRNPTVKLPRNRLTIKVRPLSSHRTVSHLSNSNRTAPLLLAQAISPPTTKLSSNQRATGPRLLLNKVTVALQAMVQLHLNSQAMACLRNLSSSPCMVAVPDMVPLP